MHIAIIVPAYNVAPYLREAMVSVLRQDHPNWSMVVVDDGSTDATASIAAQFRDPRISLVRQQNAGVSAARNRGIAASASDSCLFLDADDRLAPNALAALAATLGACSGGHVAAGRYARFAPDGSIHLAPLPPHGDLLQRLLVRNLFANGGHLLIRRSAIEAAGAFRVDLRYGEDWEYWTRLALGGPFLAAASRDPLLFVRERPGSAYHRLATDAASFMPALDSMYANPNIAQRLGPKRLDALRRRANAEVDWVVGRELVRHGLCREGQLRLGRSLRQIPTLKRVAITALSPLRIGPFRPYPGV